MTPRNAVAILLLAATLWGRWADGQTGSNRGDDRILAISNVTVLPRGAAGQMG